MHPTAAASQEEEEELEAATTAQFFMATAQCHSLSQVDAGGGGGREGGRVKALDALVRAHIFSYSGSRRGGAVALALEERMLPGPQSGLKSTVDDSESLLPLLGLGRGRDVSRTRGEAEEVG